MSIFPARILLATDGSEDADLAAKTATDLVRRTESELHVVHVGRLLTHGSYTGVQVGPLPGVHQDELDNQARGLLEGQLQRLEAAGVAVVEAHLKRGRPDEEIVVVAEGIVPTWWSWVAGPRRVQKGPHG
jgi:nucleotide-binding universal stress UspA family protein